MIVPHETILRERQALTLDLPLIVVEGDLSRTPLSVGVDNAQGARLATQHLLELGHRTVVHLAGPDGVGRGRGPPDEGWRRALEAGVGGAAAAVGGDWSARSGYVAGRSLARSPTSPPSSWPTTRWPSACSRALHEAGRRVPDDVSVVGFDDLPEAAYFFPPLTTVRQDFAELGRADGVLERVLDRDEQPVVDLVPTSLVVRDSTAAPRPPEPVRPASCIGRPLTNPCVLHSHCRERSRETSSQGSAVSGATGRSPASWSASTSARCPAAPSSSGSPTAPSSARRVHDVPARRHRPTRCPTATPLRPDWALQVPARLRRRAARRRARSGARRRRRPRPRSSASAPTSPPAPWCPTAGRRHPAVRAAGLRGPAARLRQAVEAPRRPAAGRPDQRARREARRAVAAPATAA